MTENPAHDYLHQDPSVDQRLECRVRVLLDQLEIPVTG
jgi:hypothetical protein